MKFDVGTKVKVRATGEVAKVEAIANAEISPVYCIGENWYSEDKLDEVDNKWSACFAQDYDTERQATMAEVEDAIGEKENEINGTVYPVDNEDFNRWKQYYMDKQDIRDADIVLFNSVVSEMRDAWYKRCKNAAYDAVWETLQYITVDKDLKFITKGDFALSINDLVNFWEQHHNEYV